MEIFASNPQYQLAKKICMDLQAKGFEAYFAGGCVRDFLLKITPNDFDVATNAVPDEVEKLFPKTVAVGKKFGVIVVVDGSEQVEVATFRLDVGYQDGRHPEKVEFSGAKEDAIRRDFTVNALFYDLQKNQVIDYVEGQKDLAAKVLKAVGNPEDRFQEDHLRILRAVRFSSQLGFELEEATWQACQKLAPKIQQVSGERTQEELLKLLRGAHLEKGLQALFKSGILGEMLGEKPMNWRPPQKYFQDFKISPQDAESLWFAFFQWIFFSLSERVSLFFFEALCEKWKFSRDLKNKTLKSLQWLYEDHPFQKRPMGEIISLGYEAAHLRGLKAYSQFVMKDAERVSYDRFTQRMSILGAMKPVPWVVSEDLMSQVSGEGLGRALKLCYYEQLEGRVKSKEALLDWWKGQHA